MYKISEKLFSVLFLLSMASSCATSPGGQQQEPVKSRKPIAHPHPASKANAPAVTKPTASVHAVEIEYCNFFERVSSADKDFTEKDRQMFLTFASNPASGSMHEAAIVVGLLRDIVTPVGGHKNTFREVDMAASQAAENSTSVIDTQARKIEPSLILESRCREKGVDCISALATNPHLRTHATYNMALDASRYDGNSSLFIQNLHATLKSEVQSWGDLARKMGLEVQPVSTTTGDGVSPQPTAEAQSLPAVTADENSAANQILAKAVEYAGKDDYEKAINEARKVKQGSEAYTSAQENLKNWSNRAVQDLRRQAANYYRSSTSTPDATGKKSHLEKAKNFLETAIAKYPEASTLDTVKENLEIINKELERIR